MSAVPSPPEPTPPPQTRPAEEYVPPVDDYVNELSDESRPQRGPDTARLTDEPAPRGTSLYTSEPARERRFGSAYPRASGPVASGASVQSAPRSLYSGHAAQPAPAKWRKPIKDASAWKHRARRLKRWRSSPRPPGARRPGSRRRERRKPLRANRIRADTTVIGRMSRIRPIQLRQQADSGTTGLAVPTPEFTEDQTVSVHARGARGRPRRAGGCRSCRCRRTFPSGCATGRPAPPRNPAPRRS